jgi:sec-independent protein translocase protein TatA
MPLLAGFTGNGLSSRFPTFGETEKNSSMTSQAIFLISMPGGTEWILIVLAVLILFGGRKIPEFMRGIGRGIREFNDAKANVKQEIEEGMKDKEAK